MEQQEVRMFEQKPVRMVKTETGIYYSMVDVIAALQISPNPTRYWSDWKRSQKKAAEKQKSTYDPAQSISEKSGFEQKDRVMHVNYTNIVSVDSGIENRLLSNITSMKLTGKDGKRHAADVMEEKMLRELVPLFRSPLTERFLSWLEAAPAFESEGNPSEYHAAMQNRSGTEQNRSSQKKTNRDQANSEISSSCHVLPLMNTAFFPGTAQKTVDQMENPDIRAIAQAELYYFSGRAEECRNLAELYLGSSDLSLRLSAWMLYTYSSLPLGDAGKARMGLKGIRECLEEYTEIQSPELRASCVFAAHVGSVLLHLPSDLLPDVTSGIPLLPEGLRLFALYVLAHAVYLEQDYRRALGIAQAALLGSRNCYPIPTIYLSCIVSMCEINLKKAASAAAHLEKAWELAKPDHLIEAIVEHHGLLQGLVESLLRKSQPDMYRDISEKVLAFSRGWMKVHNPETGMKVTAELSPMEFSIAMLACRGWTNREIADHLGLSPNTIKHYISNILATLHVERREDLKPYVNQ